MLDSPHRAILRSESIARFRITNAFCRQFDEWAYTAMGSRKTISRNNREVYIGKPTSGGGMHSLCPFIWIAIGFPWTLTSVTLMDPLSYGVLRINSNLSQNKCSPSAALFGGFVIRSYEVQNVKVSLSHWKKKTNKSHCTFSEITYLPINYWQNWHYRSVTS